MAVNSNAKILASLKKDIKAAYQKFQSQQKYISKEAKLTANKRLITKCNQLAKKLEVEFKSLDSKVSQAQAEIKKTAEAATSKLTKRIERIERLRTKLVADNHLLELKRKEMLLQSTDIENHLEEISKRNEYLLEQKKLIDRQTEELRIANQEILEKNEELENRTESLLDQTDYLHEANETISNMHQELARQKDEILHKNEELESLNIEKNNLIGIVAHDLKSPLNQIKGLVSIVKMTSNLDPEAANCLTMIENSAVRLNYLIGKILDTEAIESKQLNLNIETVDVSEIVFSLTDRYGNDAESKNISLHTNAPSGVQIPADKNYLTQVLENLLSNAIKFSPNNKNIYLNLVDKDDHILCEVKDEGPGLTEEDKKKLFSKYQKLSAKPTGMETSTGLGLSIVKKFTEAMGGQIWCESEAGNGASFFVRFNK